MRIAIISDLTPQNKRYSDESDSRLTDLDESEKIAIYCRLHNGNGVLLNLPSCDTVNDLKIALQDSGLQLPPTMGLMHLGKELKAQEPLKNLGKGAIVHIEDRLPNSRKQLTIDVGIYWCGQKLVIRAKMNETVYILKQKLHRLLHVAPKDQRLIFRGIPLLDHQPLSFYQLKADSLLCLHATSHNEGHKPSANLLQSAVSVGQGMKPCSERPELFRSAQGMRNSNDEIKGYQVEIREAEDLPTKEFNFELFRPSTYFTKLEDFDLSNEEILQQDESSEEITFDEGLLGFSSRLMII